MSQIIEPAAAERQVAEAVAAERESFSRESNRTSLWRRTDAGHWQIFHHQGTITSR